MTSFMKAAIYPQLFLGNSNVEETYDTEEYLYDEDEYEVFETNESSDIFSEGSDSQGYAAYPDEPVTDYQYKRDMLLSLMADEWVEDISNDEWENCPWFDNKQLVFMEQRRQETLDRLARLVEPGFINR
jgi:hypothetical protein